MKGLQAALRDREERQCRVERRLIDEEKIEQNSRVLAFTEKGMKIRLNYYCKFHEVTKIGCVTEINRIYKYLRLDGETVRFEDIYNIKITDE